MLVGLGFIMEAIFGIMGSQSLQHLGALSVRLSKGSLVLMCLISVQCIVILFVHH